LGGALTLERNGPLYLEAAYARRTHSEYGERDAIVWRRIDNHGDSLESAIPMRISAQRIDWGTGPVHVSYRQDPEEKRVIRRARRGQSRSDDERALAAWLLSDAGKQSSARASLAQAWADDLALRYAGGPVIWESKADKQDKWNDDYEGLSGLGGAIVAVVIAIATYGAASAAIGSMAAGAGGAAGATGSAGAVGVGGVGTVVSGTSIWAAAGTLAAPTLIKNSLDETTKDQGGDLGWKSPITLPPTVLNAVRSLKKGEHTPTPVKLDTGWHLFQIDDLRPLSPPPLEELKTGLIPSKPASALAPAASSSAATSAKPGGSPSAATTTAPPTLANTYSKSASSGTPRWAWPTNATCASVGACTAAGDTACATPAWPTTSPGAGGASPTTSTTATTTRAWTTAPSASSPGA
jgi:hypothetical protein